MEEDAEIGDDRSLKASIRSAKKLARPPKIGVPEQRSKKSPSKTKDKRKPHKVTSGSAFERDREGFRAKKGDTIGGMKKKGNGRASST